MVTLSTLEKTVGKKRKRLGRGYGSGSGAKSGRGTTRHQKARTKIPIHFEGGQNKITKKYPLLRGKGRNRSLKPKPYVVNVDKLNIFDKDALVTVEALIEAKIVDKKAIKKRVKILGRGKLNVSLKVALPVSDLAKKKIEKAGGSVKVGE